MNAPKRPRMPSFRDGFFAGLAAPVLLCSDFAAPDTARAPETVLPVVSDREALAGDWRRVGDDLRAAIARHGKAA